MNLQIDICKDNVQASSCGQVVKAFSSSNMVSVTGLTGLWASMTTTGGGEFFAAQKVNSDTEVLFKLRYIDGINKKHYVKYGSRYFRILFVNNKDEKSEWLFLSCKEVS